MKNTKVKLAISFLIVILLCGFFPRRDKASAADDSIYPIDGPETINLGDQGLFISDDLSNVKFVEMIKIKPPLSGQYTSDLDITYHAPVLEITFMNAKKIAKKPDATISSVYFNIDESEMRMWEEGGPDDISIWYYDKINKRWHMCPTRHISEKQNNGKFDRLACFVMGNGLYVLGKFENEKIDNIYPTDESGTINLGKQGLFISNPPSNVHYVKIERIQPPLPSQITFGIDIAYRGPALEINFLRSNKSVVKPGATLTSVYFNISEPEVKMWNEGGPDEIAIWYYNESSEEWLSCPTRYISERQNNGKYDRLACFIKGNGFYVLGKMEIDVMFPLWFKLQGQELAARSQRIQEY